MSDTLLLILVPIAALGGLAGFAWLLQRGAKKRSPGAFEVPAPGPVGRRLWWVTRIVVVLLILSILAAWAFHSLALVWVAAGCILLYVVVGWIGRMVRLTGK